MDLIVYHLRSLLRFSGRDPRAGFWAWVASVIGAMVVIDSIMFPVQILAHPFVQAKPFPFTEANGLAFFAPLVGAAAVRRLHDNGRSGKWLLVPAIPLATNNLAALWYPPAGPAYFAPDPGIVFTMEASGFVYLVSLVILAVILALPSESATNRYGPSPEV